MAVSAFQRSLISLNSPWDRHLRGDHRAISDAARRGAELFGGTVGCAACHSGIHFTDMKFHRLSPMDDRDRGLEEKTGVTADRGRFRTPGLRNVAVTAPYLHDGSATDLPAALAAHGLALQDQDRRDLIAFLETVTDRKFLSDPTHAMPLSACGKRL